MAVTPLLLDLPKETLAQNVPQAADLTPFPRLRTFGLVPEGEWYKRFSGMTVCGEGELIKALLLPDHVPKGEPVP